MAVYLKLLSDMPEMADGLELVDTDAFERLMIEPRIELIESYRSSGDAGRQAQQSYARIFLKSLVHESLWTPDEEIGTARAAAGIVQVLLYDEVQRFDLMERQYGAGRHDDQKDGTYRGGPHDLYYQRYRRFPAGNYTSSQYERELLTRFGSRTEQFFREASFINGDRVPFAAVALPLLRRAGLVDQLYEEGVLFRQALGIKEKTRRPV